MAVTADRSGGRSDGRRAAAAIEVEIEDQITVTMLDTTPMEAAEIAVEIAVMAVERLRKWWWRRKNSNHAR